MEFFGFLQKVQFSNARKHTFLGQGKNFRWLCSVKMTPKVAKHLLKKGVKHLSNFGIICLLILGPILAQFWELFGVKKGQEAPRWTQKGHQEPQSTQKQHLQKKIFHSTPYFSSLGGSQDDSKTSIIGSETLP